MAIVEADDLFHTPPDDRFTWTETNWFGMMFIPEKRLQFDSYVWTHPNMGVVYSGFYASRGKVKDQLCAEYFDYRCWLPMPKGNLDDYSLENGFSVKILKPLTTYQLDYVDKARDTELHVIWDGIMPPVPFPMGEHLEQAGRVTGTLKLNGEVHEVDCISIRDHSWVHRPENPKLGRRPMGYVACGFDDGSAFCFTIADSNYGYDGVTNEAPAWLEQTDKPDMEFVPFCWLYRDGEHRQIRSADLRVEREEDGWHPRSFALDFVDDRGVDYKVRGEVENLFPMHWMQNNMITCCLSRYDCNGQKAWGAFYESMEQDVVRKLLK
nr:hypothetical protein [Sphingomonas sp. CDS-1]